MMSGSQQRATVAVVGAGGEIGAAIAAALEEMAFRVVRTYRALPPSALKDEPGLHYALDVTDPGNIATVMQSMEKRYGSLYGMVYVAGCTQERPITLLQDEDWKQVIDVNLTGAFSCLRAVTRPMMVRGEGRVVLVGSVSSRIGTPGQAAYAASKAGLEALARVAAGEVGRYAVA